MQDEGSVLSGVFIVQKVNGQWNYPMAYVHLHRCLILFNKTFDESLNFIFQRKDLKVDWMKSLLPFSEADCLAQKIYVSSISLVKAQTMVTGDHKFKVIILIKNVFCQGYEAQWCITKWIILIVQSTFSPQIQRVGILKRELLESVNNVGSIIIKESLILARRNSSGAIEGYHQGSFTAYLLGLIFLEFSDS